MELILTSRPMYSVAFTWEKFHKTYFWAIFVTGFGDYTFEITVRSLKGLRVNVEYASPAPSVTLHRGCSPDVMDIKGPNQQPGCTQDVS